MAHACTTSLRYTGTVNTVSPHVSMQLLLAKFVEVTKVSIRMAPVKPNMWERSSHGAPPVARQGRRASPRGNLPLERNTFRGLAKLWICIAQKSS